MSISSGQKIQSRQIPEWPPPPVRAESLRQQVFELLRDAVFAGKIRPGEVLRELQLAKNMRVSQSTVREALAQLEHVGLVVREPNRGTTVTNLSGKEMRDRLKIRLALEELAVSEAAPSITDKDLEDLEIKARSIAGAIGANTYFELGQTDLEFHRRIWQVSGNAVLYRTLDAITTPLFAFLGVLQTKASCNGSRFSPA